MKEEGNPFPDPSLRQGVSRNPEGFDRSAQHNVLIQFFFIILRVFLSFKGFFVELLTQLCMNAPPSHTASDSIRIIAHGFELRQIVVYRILSTIPRLSLNFF